MIHPALDADDLIRARRAVSAYFRAACALGSASLLMRHAALLVSADEDPGEDEPDREFLLDRAATYHEKALLMSCSAAALLSHVERWFANLSDAEEDVDRALGDFAVEIEGATDAYGEVVEAIEGASFAESETYPQVLEELRSSVQFLNAEAAMCGLWPRGSWRTSKNSGERSTISRGEK